MNLQEALKNFVDSIASNILNVITQNIAQQATDGIMGGLNSLNSMFGFGGDTAAVGIDETSPQAVAISTASQEGAMAMQMGIEQGAMTAAQTISSAMNSNNLFASEGIMGESKSPLLKISEDFKDSGLQVASALGNSIQDAGDSNANQMNNAIRSGGSVVQAGFLNVFQMAVSMFSALFSSQKAADAGVSIVKLGVGLVAGAAGGETPQKKAAGGHITGAGTGTSDSIPTMLSNDEFVTQSKVVRQPGMLAFLHDLNRRGWGAVHDLIRVHHSTGGLAGIPAPAAPSLPSINLAPMENSNSTTVKNNMMLNVIDDPNKVGNSLLNNEHTQDSFYVFLTENNQRVRQILQF